MISKTDIMRFIFSPFLGKKIGQNFFEQLQLFAIKGRHFGGGSVIENSGELFALEYVANKLKLENCTCPVIFDVGANSGEYSTWAVKKFFNKLPDFKIFAFEPAKKVFEKLLTEFAGEPKVKVFNLGFSNNAGTAKLYINNQFTVASSIYGGSLENYGMSVDAVEEIKLDTVDNFCRENNINRIDFLKIDTEGHEMSVLRGATGKIEAGQVKFIQFEMGRTSIESRTFFKDFYDLLGKKYKIYRLLKNGLKPVTSYKETDEIFMTTNFLAELKN